MSLKKLRVTKMLIRIPVWNSWGEKKSGMWGKWLSTSIGPPIGFSLLFPIDSINGQNDIDLSTNES